MVKADEKTTVSPKSAAPALTRGLKVLELLASTDDAKSLTDISKHLNIAMSSAHSLCTTLINDGYIERQSGGTFQLTLKILDLASSKIRKYNIVEHFHAVCDEIQIIKENGATLSVLDGQDVYFIAARKSPQPLGVTFQVGTRLPACCMASGRALLASLTDDQVKEIYPNNAIPQITKNNPKQRKELLSILAKARIDGHSEEIKGTRPHMCSYGAVVASPSGQSIAGVALTMYEEDMTHKVEADAIASIKLLAQKLSQFGDITS